MEWNGRKIRPVGNLVKPKEFDFNDALKPLGEKRNNGFVWVPTKQIIMDVDQEDSIPVSPTPTPTPTVTTTPTNTPTTSVTPSITPTTTVTPTVTTTPTITPSPSQAPSGTTEANAYLSAVVNAGGTGITSTVSAATRTLFTELVSNGLYSKIIAMYPLLGGNASGCKFNAVNPVDTDAAYRITYSGGMTFSSDGQTGNGANGIGTTYINQTVAPTLRGIGTYPLNGDTTFGADILEPVGGLTYLSTSYPGGAPKRTIFQFGGGNSSELKPSDGIGFYFGLFTGTTLGPQLYKNGTLVGTRPGFGSTSYGTPNLRFPSTTNNTTAFGIFTTELTTAQILTLSTIIETFVTTIGRKQYKLLNSYPGASGAYSMRLLNNTYAGSAVRVRRSSDNAEQDIGFDGSGNLNTTSLTNFITGATNGFVTTWYDQSGNSNNLTQSTATNQPQIVSGGTILTQGTQNKPVLKFDGSNDFFVKTGLTLNNTIFSSFIVGGELVEVSSSGLFGLTPPTGLDYQSLSAVTFENGSASQKVGFLNDFTNGTGVWAIYQTGTGPSRYSLVNGMKQSTGAQLYVSGTSVGSVTKALNSGTSTGLVMGARWTSGAASSPYLNGYEQEVIYYLTDQTTNLTAINSNINTYYGVY